MRLFPNAKRVKSRLLEEFQDKKILEISGHHSHAHGIKLISHSPNSQLTCDLTEFPWPIEDNVYDLVICQHAIEYLQDTARTLEELNRITKNQGKIFIETAHYTWHEAYRHPNHCHRFSFCSFDYFHKGNPYYQTDFTTPEKYLFFDDLTFILGIGFLANRWPRFYEKRLAFIFPATSFHVTFSVEKEQQPVVHRQENSTCLQVS